jgi:hypothetical protein
MVARQVAGFSVVSANPMKTAALTPDDTQPIYPQQLPGITL